MATTKSRPNWTLEHNQITEIEKIADKRSDINSASELVRLILRENLDAYKTSENGGD